ncbi:MAG: tRNA (cytidine(34)-2'-O)-methyltransferase [Christensenellales bacterium]|jgi:tRNA (cytidine/uridine-2'-O-)-methyltransferase
MNLNIVLVEPEIPQNAGNVVRTCAAIGAQLHLVKPLGFSMEDKYLKRAGLDYWMYADIQLHESLRDLMRIVGDTPYFLFTTKADRMYTEPSYPPDVFLLFGKETAGLPDSLLEQKRNHCVRLPMQNGLRSLNLSNSVAVAAYEVLRQNGFEGLK